MSFLWLSGFGNISDSRLVHFGALFSFAAFLVSVGFRVKSDFEVSKISVLSKITS